MSLCLREARALAEHAIRDAERVSIAIGVCVLNASGTIVQLDRMERATLMAGDLAEAKALTALNFDMATGDVAEQFAASALTQITGAVHFPVLTIPGGIPIHRDGQRIGALGISGGTPTQDAAIAAAALRSLV